MRLKGKAFSLLEVLFSIVIITIILVPTITTIQASRVRMRGLSQHLMAENLAVSLMEGIKRNGFDEIDYGDAFAALSPAAVLTSTSMLLDFPRYDDTGTSNVLLPAGPPGGVDFDDINLFLSDYRSGDRDMDDLVEDDVIAEDVNYYFFSEDQIAAMNGYKTWVLIPEDDPDTEENEDKTETLLNPQYAWGYFVEPYNGPDDTWGTPDDIRHMAVIIKWFDTRTGRRNFTILETYITRIAPRLTKP